MAAFFSSAMANQLQSGAEESEEDQNVVHAPF